MERKEVLDILGTFLKNENIVATHGTSGDAAKSIMQTGLRVNRTTYVTWDEKSDPRVVASYAWKEAPLENSSNVIIVIPSKFLQIISGRDSKEIKSLLEQVRAQDGLDGLIETVGMPIENDCTLIKGASMSMPLLPDRGRYIIPKEFIRGSFKHTNNTGWIAHADLVSKYGDEGALNYRVDNLEFIDNPNYFENLSIEKQRKFIYEHLKQKGYEDEYIWQLLDQQLPVVNNDSQEVKHTGKNITQSLGKETLTVQEETAYIDETQQEEGLHTVILDNKNENNQIVESL